MCSSRTRLYIECVLLLEFFLTHRCPAFDVLVTNPPYSADHVDRLLHFCVVDLFLSLCRSVSLPLSLSLSLSLSPLSLSLSLSLRHTLSFSPPPPLSLSRALSRSACVCVCVCVCLLCPILYTKLLFTYESIIYTGGSETGNSAQFCTRNYYLHKNLLFTQERQKPWLALAQFCTGNDYLHRNLLFTQERQKPWLALLPNFVYTKGCYRKLLSQVEKEFNEFVYTKGCYRKLLSMFLNIKF
jgi:hypothetical protein